MGIAAITNDLGQGRYRIKLDSGEDRRLALLTAVNAALAECGRKLTLSYEQVLFADAQEAEAREAISALIDILVIEDNPASVEVVKKVLAVEKQKYAKLVSSNQPVRQQHATLKQVQSDLLRQRSMWESLQTIEYKEAWCTDYTTGATGANKATIDIPGDSNLVLLAPGCRTWSGGDGTISNAKKAAALSRRSTDLNASNLKLAEIDAKLVTAQTEETALKAQVQAAQTAYIADKTPENASAYEKKVSELAAKRREIAQLTLNRQSALIAIKSLEQEIAYWSGRAASETPNYGYGYMRERELTSPAQSFFNAAIFPGWQKWMPTYRWGTASNINEETNTMDVTLADAYSSAQGLSVNQGTILRNVNVQYMTCHAGVFEEGDKVVVGFTGLSFESPVVIGFLDNPRPCLPWPTSIVFDITFTVAAAQSSGVRQWASVAHGSYSCSDYFHRLELGFSYPRPIAPSASYNLQLGMPSFGTPADANNFEIDAAGFGTSLWSGDGNAHAVDTGSGPSAGGVPSEGAGGRANQFAETGVGTEFVVISEYSTTAFSQNMQHYGYNALAWSEDGNCYIGELGAIELDSSGAWIWSGDIATGLGSPAATVENVLVERPHLLAPASIPVTRKRGGKKPALYVHHSSSRADTGGGGCVWHLVFWRQT